MAGCFCGHYTQGVLLTLTSEDARIMASINDGLAALNSRWDDEDVEALGITARGEWLLGGGFDEYLDFESWPGGDFLLAMGAGVHYQQGEYGTSGPGLSTGDEAEILRWTVDGSLELGGANVFVALNALNRVTVGGNTFGWPLEFTGWRPDAAGERGQIVVRLQAQVLF